MIEEKTLLRLSGYKQPYQKEKDYIEELFLTEMYNRFNEFVFKGGTALAKFYGSKRFSDDLDFSLLSHGGTGRPATQLERLIESVSKNYPTKLLRKRNTKDALTYELSLRGPLFAMLNRHQHLRIEIDKKASVMEHTNIFRRDPVYLDLRPYVAVALNEKEILAEKVAALLFRHNPKARDLYDLYFLIEEGTEVKTSLIDQKLREEKHTFGDIDLDKRMEVIGKLWNKELVRLLPPTGFIKYRKANKTVTQAFVDADLV